jgi:isoquinoline 1-oxidoreductase alpha subunit
MPIRRAQRRHEGDDPMASLTVNGTARQYDGDPQMPLLWYLRDQLQMTGTKFGCGQALCGACTVHMDGAPVRACVTPMVAVSGRSVVTIEGLDANGRHPLQLAWVELGVPQCGYCQSGQIMQAAALLKTNAKPSVEDIETAMSGHICRCGTYTRIKAAIQQAAAKGA